ncbi:FliM/FliN family flagellar motor switch protein [Sphingosinicella sp.]|uniref:FliM/FliN family flagellar motor switch protein n=1 Tax=Sphingosinicella sp. TaxID=1917971 RepID=UPI004037FAE3
MAQPLPLNQHQDDDGDARTGLASKLIENVGVSLEAYLGSARMTVAELIKLKESSLVSLEAPLSQAVELRLNGAAVAKGELVAVGDNFAVRLTEVAK